MVFICKPDPKDLRLIHTVKGDLYIKRYVTHPDGSISLEDFAPGDVVTWSFWHPEVHIILEGEAEVTYSLPPLHMEEKKTVIRKGEAYLIPAGATLKWKVTSKEPYRHLCVIMDPIRHPSLKRNVTAPPY